MDEDKEKMGEPEFEKFDGVPLHGYLRQYLRH